MEQLCYEYMNLPLPAHINERHIGGDFVPLNTIFANVTTTGAPCLYVFTVTVSRLAEGVIKTKRQSDGIVHDLCQVLDCVPGIHVLALIGTSQCSWICVHNKFLGAHKYYIDMQEIPQPSPESNMLGRFFGEESDFLDYSECEDIAKYTPLVRCFETAAKLSINDDADFQTHTFPWILEMELANGLSIMQNILNAICRYTVPMSILKANYMNFFLMQKQYFVIALVDFIRNKTWWFTPGNTQKPEDEDQLYEMLKYATRYEDKANDVRRELLIFYSKKEKKEPNECFKWLTDPTIHEGETACSVIRRERNEQEKQCILLQTSENTTLPVYWESKTQLYRGILVQDTHPVFGSARAFRKYVEVNLIDMVKNTIKLADFDGLMDIFRLFQLISGDVMNDVYEYMQRCKWTARDLLLTYIINSQGRTELSTLLNHMRDVQVDHIINEDLALYNNTVLFRAMPTQKQCAAALTVHAVMSVDPVQAASEMWNNAFEHFLARTDANEQEMAHGQVLQPLETNVKLCFTFPHDVHDADKNTLNTLLRYLGLSHLLANSPFIDVDQMWVSAVANEGMCDDIFSFAQNAQLIGMTCDFAVYVFNEKLHLTTARSNLVSKVINTYNMLVSNTEFLKTESLNYDEQEIVMLFKVFNIGHRGTRSGHKLINQSLLCKAIVRTLFDAPLGTALEIMWSNTADYLLSGAISHRHNGPDTTGADGTLPKMLKAVDTLYQGRVRSLSVITNSLYLLQGTVSCAFMVADIKQHEERAIQDIDQPKHITTVAVWVLIVNEILRGNAHNVHHVKELYEALERKSHIPSLVKQILHMSWSKYQDHIYFPENNITHSLWETTLTNESVTRLILSVLDDLPNDTTRVPIDHTVSFILRNTKHRTGDLLITDWPLLHDWDVYIEKKNSIVHAFNAYANGAKLHPYTSFLHFDKRLCDLQIPTKPFSQEYGMFKYITSIVHIVRQNCRSVTEDDIVSVFDRFVLHSSRDNVCHNPAFLTIGTYPYVLVGESIAMHFNTTTQEASLTHDSNNLLSITDVLLSGELSTECVIADSSVSDWLLACIPMLNVEKQIRAAFLLTNNILRNIQWNQEILKTSAIHAASLISQGTKITKDIRRKFIRNIIGPIMDEANDSNGRMCILTSSHEDYYVFCLKENAFALCEGNKGMEKTITKWLNKVKTFLQDTPDENFVHTCIQIGPDPICGIYASLTFDKNPTDHKKSVIDSVTRASVLNAWIKDVPAIEIYARPHLIAIGRQLINTPND